MESSPPETASSRGASVERAAWRAASRTARAGSWCIGWKYSGGGTLAVVRRLWLGSGRAAILHRVESSLTATGAIPLETHGPLGTLWVGLGLCGFYIALVWINTLLGFVLTPLFIVPLTWLQDKVRGKAPVRG